MPFPPTPQIILTHFDWSLARFKEAIDNEDTKYYREAALQRFRLTCDVGLETIRAFAKRQGQVCSTDQSCFQWVEKKRWLQISVGWDNMLAHYEMVKKRPKDKEIDKIYIELKAYYILLKNISECMKLVND